MNRDEMLSLTGVPQTELAGDVALPDAAPPAPWRTSMRAVVWQALPNRAARSAAGPVHGRPAAVLGGLIAYDDTPVGPYREIVGPLADRQVAARPGPPLSGWLRSGWHLGAVLENVTGHFGPARP
jgi:hypothetical protein